MSLSFTYSWLFVCVCHFRPCFSSVWFQINQGTKFFSCWWHRLFLIQDNLKLKWHFVPNNAITLIIQHKIFFLELIICIHVVHELSSLDSKRNTVKLWDLLQVKKQVYYTDAKPQTLFCFQKLFHFPKRKRSPSCLLFSCS